jgi:peptidyl-prolyl cis-trans isomerase SurA
MTKCRIAKIVSLSVLLVTAAPGHAQFRLSREIANPSAINTAPPVMRAQPTTVGLPKSGSDSIAAIVNTEPITQSDVSARQLRLLKQWRAQGIQAPSPDVFYQLVLERLIEERSIIQAGKDAGVRISDAQIQQALAGMARQQDMGSIDAFRKKQEDEGVNWQQLLSEIRDEMTLSQTKEREVDARVRVGDAEVESALRARIHNSAGASKLNIAHILLEVPDNASETQMSAARALAVSIQERAVKGERFADLAKTHSRAADRDRGGEMGLRSPERIAPLFLEAVKTVGVGGISQVIKSDAGFHILKVLARETEQEMRVTQTRARHILLNVTNAVTEATAKERLRAIKNRIELKTLDFSQAAREHSNDASAQEGGDLGWATPGMFVPEFERAMNALTEGQISDPVVSPFGVHLIEVVGRREIALQPSEQRQMIREQLREKKAEDAFKIWAAEVRNRAYVEYRNAGGAGDNN